MGEFGKNIKDNIDYFICPSSCFLCFLYQNRVLQLSTWLHLDNENHSSHLHIQRQPIRIMSRHEDGRTDGKSSHEIHMKKMHKKNTPVFNLPIVDKETKIKMSTQSTFILSSWKYVLAAYVNVHAVSLILHIIIILNNYRAIALRSAGLRNSSPARRELRISEALFACHMASSICRSLFFARRATRSLRTISSK